MINDKRVSLNKNIITVVFLLPFFLFSCGSCKNEKQVNPRDSTSTDDVLGQEDLIDDNDQAEFDYGASNGKINFSGYEWNVKTSVSNKIGPGPNFFSMSNDNVWVDSKRRLHLKISQKDGKWYSASVSMRNSQGFAKYVVYVSSEIDLLDPNIVAAFFLYKTDDQEVDIEFSKWGQEKNHNAQFAIQPADRFGNKNRFTMKVDGYKSTHFIDWEKDSIDFGSFKGITLNPKEENIFAMWTYKGKDNPSETGEKFEINLWLFNGIPPLNNREAEIIIDSVRIIK